MTSTVGGLPYARACCEEPTSSISLPAGRGGAVACCGRHLGKEGGIFSAEVIDVFGEAARGGRGPRLSAEKTGRVVTVEEHMVSTGMGSHPRVAALLAEARPQQCPCALGHGEPGTSVPVRASRALHTLTGRHCPPSRSQSSPAAFQTISLAQVRVTVQQPSRAPVVFEPLWPLCGFHLRVLCSPRAARVRMCAITVSSLQMYLHLQEEGAFVANHFAAQSDRGRAGWQRLSLPARIIS